MKLPYYLKVTDEVTHADSKLCRIRINPKYKNNAGLIAHEEMHIKQWYWCMFPMLILCVIAWFCGYQHIGFYGAIAAVFLKGLLYTFVPMVRLAFEVQAYRKQLIIVGPQYLESFAKAITNDYDLNITLDEARAKLKE